MDRLLALNGEEGRTRGKARLHAEVFTMSYTTDVGNLLSPAKRGHLRVKDRLWETSTQCVFHAGGEPSPREIPLSLLLAATGKQV